MIAVSPPTTPGTTQGTTANQVVDLVDPEQFTTYFNGLWNSFTSGVTPMIETNRDARDMVVDVTALRASGQLTASQTYIPQRIIDTNIARDMPDHVSYLVNSRRIAIFDPVDKTVKVDCNGIEMEFRRVMTYENWIFDYERWADCTKLHGWGFADCCYDPEFPGHVSIEYITAGNILFDPRVKCIQQSPIVARRYQVTTVDFLQMAADYKFDANLSDQIYQKLTALEKNPVGEIQEASCIYRCFFKKAGYVYSLWYTKDLQGALTPAEQFWNGVSVQITEMATDPVGFGLTPVQKWVPEYEKVYPFYLYRNRVSEEEPIVRTPGRSTLDYYTQEAASALWSGFVNGVTEASNVMWAPENADLEAPTAPGQLDIQIKHGAIWNRPMKAFTSPYPESTLPQALEMLRTQNAEDTNQISFATNNRKDTRKTATEIQAAAVQDAQMSSVSVTNWATAIGEILNAAWRIVRSEALQGKIKFLEVDGQNDIERIGLEYKLIPAGTTDYVERMELIASMQQDWTIVGPTAAGPVFLEEYLRMKYPLIADKLIAPLQQQTMQAQTVVPVLQELLTQAVTDENGTLKPEWQAHAAELQKLGIKANGSDTSAQPPDNGGGDQASANPVGQEVPPT